MTDIVFHRDHYPTPLSIFKVFDAEFHFTCDGAASAHNSKVPAFYITEAQDFLTYPLENECVWLNPPYSNPKPFVERAVELFEKHHCLVVMLLPVDVSTKWFETIAEKATEIRFIVGGRVKFQHGETQKYKDVCRGSFIAVFDPKYQGVNQVIRNMPMSAFKNLEWMK